MALLLAAPAAAAAQDTYAIPAHVSAVDGVARIERPGTGDADEDLERNLTLVEGDRVRTRNGRVEILFADGTLLHLDRHAVVDFQREDYVRVMEGRVRVLVPRDARDRLRVDTPAASLEIEPGGEYRIAVAPNGDAELAVLGGAGAIFNDQGETTLRAGERAVAAAGRAPSQAFYANAAAWDDFDRWSDTRRRAHASSVSVRYLPGELRPYGSVFDAHGSWRSHPDHGYVWYPVAGAGWQPYARGRWHSYPRYGWTWVGYDPWAWPTHHFGRWGFSAGVWFWIPGRSWGPAWVSWARSPGYVGWSPLGWDNRPLYAIGRRGDHRVYSAGYPWCGWSFIRDREFGGRWGSGALIHGTGITLVAGRGVAGSALAPIAPRGRSGTAVARSGTAVPRSTGSIGSAGSVRPRSIGSIGSEGSTPAVVPAGRAIRRPSGSSSAGAAATTPRRAAPRSGATPPYSSAAPRSGATYPNSTATPAESDAPRARPRREPSAAAGAPASGGSAAPTWRSPSRSRVPRSEPRGGAEASAPRATRRSDAPPAARGGRPAGDSGARSAAPRRAPAPPAAASGGGGDNRPAVRRPSGGGDSKPAAPAGATRRPRGGG